MYKLFRISAEDHTGHHENDLQIGNISLNQPKEEERQLLFK